MRARLFSLVACLLLVASAARADRVHLKGGAVIEGKVSEQNGKIIIEVESGTLSFRTDEVERVEHVQSDIEAFEERLAQVKPGDAAALLQLANFCRDHDLPAREREVLRKIIETQPDHAEARARLGYVKSDSGWITQDEARQKSGLVQYQGRWISRVEMLELERIAAQTKAAALERDKAQLQVDAQRLALQTQKNQVAADAAARARMEHEQAFNNITGPYGAGYGGWGYGYGYGAPIYGNGGCRFGSCVRPPVATPHVGSGPAFINGVRPPSDMSFSLPGVRSPASYF